MMDEIAGRFQHHRIGVEVLQRLGLVQAPGEKNGEGGLIQLGAAPVRFAVDPEILVKASILLLGTGQIDQGPQRHLRTAGREQASGTVAHVPRPDQMVAAQIVVARILAPRNTERRDQSAVVRLVFMCQDQAMADVVENAAVACRLFLPRQHVATGALPLLDEASAVSGEGSTQSLGDRDQGMVQTVAEAQRQHKLSALLDIELAGQGDVAIRRTVELPVHLEVVGQVLPAVGRPHITAGASQKRDRRCQHEPGSAFMCRQHLPPVGLDHVPVVAPAADFQVRREQREEPQFGEHVGVGLQAGVDEHARLMRIGDDFLDDAVTDPRDRHW